MKAAKRFFILLTLFTLFFSISPFSSYARNNLPAPRLHNGQLCLKPDGSPCEQHMYFFLHDHLGGITATVDEDGNVVERNDYFPYGTERMNVRSPNAPENNYLFTQGEYDEDLGLYYFNKRWYDPKLGRFMSPDPMLRNLDKLSPPQLDAFLRDPQNLNEYSYARNNPINFKDPKGENPVLAVIGFAASLFYTFFSSAQDVLAPTPEDLPVQTKSDVQIAFQTVSSAIKGSSVVKTITGIAQLGFKTIQELRAYREKQAGVIDISPNELIPTEKYDPVHLQKVQKQMERIGKPSKDHSVKYYEHEGQKYIVDGHHRVQAAKNLGYTTIKAKSVSEGYFEQVWNAAKEDFINKIENFLKKSK